jgi:hypothetical protein
MAAPAPSPKSTQVLRSSQFTILLSLSAPMTSTVSQPWFEMNWFAISTQ